MRNNFSFLFFLTLLCFIAASVVPSSSAYAEFLKLKRLPGIELQKIGGGRTTDNKEKKTDGLPYCQEVDRDSKTTDGLMKIWTYAKASQGIADVRLRGIDYEDFVITGDVPEGSKVKCSLLIVYECNGYANAARYGDGKAFFYAKLNSGFLTEDKTAWDNPALGKTIFFRSDDPNVSIDWEKDLVEMINKQLAGELLSQAIQAGAKVAGASATSVTVIGAVVTVALEVIDIVINLHEKEKDKEDIEFSIRGSGTVTYEDVWLKVSKDFGRLQGGGTYGDVYRTFLSLDARALAFVGEKELDTTNVYVDFYNHDPHYGDDEGKWLSKRGFKIKEIYLKNHDTENIILPERYSYPIIEVTELKRRVPLKKPPLRLGEKQTMQIKFINRGSEGFRPFNVHVTAPDYEKSFDFVIDKTYGSECEYRFDYVFDKVGDHTFVVTVDPDSKLDEYIDLTQSKFFTVNVRSLPDLQAEFWSLPSDIVINEKIPILVKAKNIGKLKSPATKIKLWANNELVGEKKIGALGQERSKTARFYWTPKERKTFNLVCMVDPGEKIEEYYEANNEVHEKVEVTAPKYNWFLEPGSIMVNPAEPKAGEEARIYFTIKNRGRSSDSIPYDVLVDGRSIMRSTTILKPDSSYIVGVKPHEEIVWKASGGEHAIKVVLDPGGQFSELDREGCAQELTISPQVPMPPVSGVDFVLEAKDIHVEGEGISFKIYNRGKRSATAGIHLNQFDSHKENGVGFLRLNRPFTAQSYEYFSALLPPGAYSSKIEIIVDPSNMWKEFDEDNNRAFYTFPSYVPYKPPPLPERAKAPDLIIGQIVNLDRPLELGERRSIEIGAGNINLVDAKGVIVRYEIWNTGMRARDAAHGYLKGEKNLGTIKAESRKQFTINYKGVYPGLHRINVKIDPDHKVKETDDYMNNELQKDFSVGGEITADMYFSDKNVDLVLADDFEVSNREPSINLPVSFGVTVQNNSDLEVWGADLDMFVDGELVSGLALGTLAANSSKTLGFQHAFSATGEYSVKIMVDAKEAVPERDETNNSVTTTIKVKGGIFGTGHRDVAVTSFTLSKNSCLQGESITASATIKNIGQDTLNAVLCTIGPAGAKPVYFKILPVLDSGKEVKISVTLPALLAGDHTIEARVDGKNLIKEENEENNTKGLTLHVEPITKEKIKQKGVGIVVETIGKAKQAFDNWLRGWGKPKEEKK